jgi:tetratricopeptide (TPR) repeat protein
LTTTYDRHSDYYTTLLRQREPFLKSATQKETLAELTTEIDNVRLAWDWAVVHRQAAKIRQAVESLFWLYELRGAFQEGAALFARAAEKLHKPGESLETLDPEQKIALGRILTKQGYFLFRLGQFEQASHPLEQSISLLHSLDDRLALADALMYRGLMVYFMGDFGKAHALLRESLTLGNALNSKWTVALCLTLLGAVTQALGEYEEAYRLYQEGLAEWRALGGPRGITFCLSYFSTVAHGLGQYAEARQMLRESLEISLTVGDRWAIATALNHLGSVTLLQGEEIQHMETQNLLREGVVMFRELGERWSMARALNNLGILACLREDYPEARRAFFEAFTTAMETQTLPIALDALVGLTVVQAREGVAEPALEWVTHILQHPASTQEAKDRAEQLRAELEARLSAEQIRAIQGRARSFEAVVEEIVETKLFGKAYEIRS